MDLEIIEIASDNNHNKSIQNHTHYSKLKNPLCGDEIKINLIIKEDKVIDFGYEGKSCIYCQASASLLSQISINEKKSKINELCDDAKSFFEGNLKHVFVIVDFLRGDLLSDIWLFTLKGFLMLRCSYNW